MCQYIDVLLLYVIWVGFGLKRFDIFKVAYDGSADVNALPLKSNILPLWIITIEGLNGLISTWLAYYLNRLEPRISVKTQRQ